MKGKILKKCTALVMAFMLSAGLLSQTVYAQQSQESGIMPRSSMKILMETSVDGQEDLSGMQDIDVTVTWQESMAVKEPVKIAVTEGAQILIDDVSDVVFKTAGTQKDISDLTIEDGIVKFMSGQAARGSVCTLDFKVKAPLVAGEFNISTKVAAENAPNTRSNYIEKTFNVTSGLTIETTAETVYGDIPFDVFGQVYYVSQQETPELTVTLDVYNEDTGEMVYELTGADYPTENKYTIGDLVFPDYCVDGNYVVQITLSDGWDYIGTISKTIKYVKSKDCKITVKDVIRGESGEESAEDTVYTREFTYEIGTEIDAIQPKTVENASVVSVSMSPENITSLVVGEDHNITGTMPAGNIEITYIQQMDESPKGFVDGLVTDELGHPIVDAVIKAYRPSEVEDELGTYLSSMNTDSAGKFLYSLKEGTYNIRIEKEGFITLDVFDVVVTAEQTVYLEKSLIIADIPGDGNITGQVYNALTGEKVSGVVVNFRRGWNKKTGATVSTGESPAQTDSAGSYQVVLPYGNYTAEFIKDGYVTGYVNVICALNFTTPQNATITPVLSEDEYRVVLTWGATPADLDSHLTGPATNSSRFHVFYSNKNFIQSDGSAANLDVDDTSSYGPETITFKLNPNVNGVYRYSIHDFTNKTSTTSQVMSLSGAQVKVYNGEALKATFNVPTNKVGTVWEVFEVDNGVFKPINTFYNESNSGNVRSLPEK